MTGDPSPADTSRFCLQNRLEDVPDVFGDDLSAFGGWVNPIRLIEIRDASHAFQEKRDERYAVILGKRRVHAMKFGHVLKTVVGRCFHPGQDDGDTAPLRALDDRRQVAGQFGSWQTSQAVIAAQCDDQNSHVAVERPIESGQAAGRCITGHPGIDDRVLKTLVVDALLKPRRVCVFERQTQSSGQAVTQHNHTRMRLGNCNGAADVVRLRRRRRAPIVRAVAACPAGDGQRTRRSAVTDPPRQRRRITSLLTIYAGGGFPPLE